MTDTVQAWKVELYWYSSIVGHMIGWQREPDAEEEKVFRSEAAAIRYRDRKTGIPSLLVPYMSRKGVIVTTLRERDWRDRPASLFAKESVREQ